MVFGREVTEFKTAIDSAAKYTLDLTHMISLSIDKKNENVLIIRHPMTDLALRFKSGAVFMCWLKVLSSFTINTTSGPKIEASIPSNYAYAIYCVLQALYTHPQLTRVEGLFRVSAEKHEKQDMFHRLLTQTYDVAQLHHYGNIHVLANVLTALLTNLPSTIFREKQIASLIQFFDGVTNRSKADAMDIFHSNLRNNDADAESKQESSHVDDDVAEIDVSHLQALKNKIEQARAAMAMKSHYGLMTLIFHLLKQIVLNEESTRMTAESLSRIFCDILESRIFLMKTKNPLQLFRMKFLLKTLIYHAYAIFPEQEWQITDIVVAAKCEIATINLYNEFCKIRHQNKANQWAKKIRLKKNKKDKQKRESYHAPHTADVGPMNSTKFINHFQNPSDFDLASALNIAGQQQQQQQRSSEKLTISDAKRMPPLSSSLTLQTSVSSTDNRRIHNSHHKSHDHHKSHNKSRKSKKKVSFKLTPMVSEPPPTATNVERASHARRVAASLVPASEHEDSREASVSTTNDKESEDSVSALPPQQHPQQSISYSVCLRPSIITRPRNIPSPSSMATTASADDIDDEKEPKTSRPAIQPDANGDDDDGQSGTGAVHNIYGDAHSGKYRKMLHSRQRSRITKNGLGLDLDMELVIFDDHENIPAPHAAEETDGALRLHDENVKAKTPSAAMTSATTQKAHLETMAALTALRRKRSASQPRDHRGVPLLQQASGDMDAEEKALEEMAYQLMQYEEDDGDVCPVDVDEYVADISGFRHKGRQQSDGTVLAKKQTSRYRQQQQALPQSHDDDDYSQQSRLKRPNLKQHKAAYSSHYHGTVDDICNTLESEQQSIDGMTQSNQQDANDVLANMNGGRSTHTPILDEVKDAVIVTTPSAQLEKSASRSSINYDALVQEAAAISDEDDDDDQPPQQQQKDVQNAGSNINTNDNQPTQKKALVHKDLERVRSPTSEWLEDVYNDIVNAGVNDD